MDRFRRAFVFSLTVAFAAGLLSAPPVFPKASTGNGAISGPRYNLEVIAFDNCPSGDFTGSNRHMIAVQADLSNNPAGSNPKSITRVNEILLSPGDFRVLDGNACDSGGASFQLPADAITCDLTDPTCFNDPTFQQYAVYVRLVGKPGGRINVSTCATDPGLDGVFGTSDDVIVCSTENVALVRMVGKNNKPTFQDFTKELLTVCLDTSGDGVCDTRLPLFDSSLQDFFWNWGTEGRPHAQLFFIALPD